jgi:hypothetical protein
VLQLEERARDARAVALTARGTLGRGPELTERREALEERAHGGLEKGRNEGLEKGRNEGLEKGLAKGTTRTLLVLIRRRYGEPSAEVLRRVESASMEERDAWIGRIFEARTVEELLGE